MGHGKPLVSDLAVLQCFAEPFLVDGVPRDERASREWGVCLKQVYALWNKPRFGPLIDYGTTLRSGWLTPKGEVRLAELRARMS